jgi:hypothetical protein
MHPIIEKTLYFLASFIGFEMSAYFLFKKIKETFVKSNLKKGKDFSLLKGMLERLMLLLGFVYSIPTIIVFFGAIKIGTRLKENSETAISNDYFLIGNTVSALIALLAYATFQLLTNKL